MYWKLVVKSTELIALNNVTEILNPLYNAAPVKSNLSADLFI